MDFSIISIITTMPDMVQVFLALGRSLFREVEAGTIDSYFTLVLEESLTFSPGKDHVHKR
jgi:hypothetical protein